MERLLAYEGPVVHVDHAHRAPAPTSWSSREKAVSEATAKCNAYNRELEDEVRTLQRQLAAEKDQVERERQLKKAAREKHEWAVDEMTKEADGRMKAEAALQAKEEELARSRRTHKAAINRLADETVDDEAEKRRLEAEVERLELRLAEAAELIDQLAPAPAPKAAAALVGKDAERNRLRDSIRREGQYIKDTTRHYLQDPTTLLLDLLERKLEDLNAMPDEDYKGMSTDQDLYKKLGAAASAKYDELVAAQQAARSANPDVPDRAFYKYARPWLYVLYGGDLNEVDKLVPENL